MYHGDIRGRKEKMVDEALGVLKLDLKQSMVGEDLIYKGRASRV